MSQMLDQSNNPTFSPPQGLRKWFCDLLRSRLNTVSQPYAPENFRKSAIIFAPHQDDETLGCGGTIVHKGLAGAQIKLVYLTDGGAANAHLGLVTPDELRQIREKEAIAAAHTLGIEVENVIFLRFPDGQLREHRQGAIAQVAEILNQFQPEEVFIPYRHEPRFIPDHAATQQIVMAALRQMRRSLTVYEYPIWCWFNYPWVDLLRDPIFPKPKGLGWVTTGLGWLGRAIVLAYRLQQDFQVHVEVAEYLEQKHKALYQHQSQMTQFRGDPRWLTVADVAHGEFLDYFFQPEERFYGYEWRGDR